MSATAEQIDAAAEAAARRRAAIRRYTRHPGFMIGAIGIALLVVVALFAPWIAPHSPTRTDLMNNLAPP
jgi:peptide/nickel transport system permease protein